MTSVVLVFEAWSNISYRREVDTGYTREEWNDLTDEEKDAVATDLVFEDIEYHVSGDN